MKHLMLSAVFCSALLFSATPLAVHACTSWMVFSDFTQNGTHILHKNRDSANRKIRVALSPENAPRKWIALGSGDTNAGMNSSGLACAMNSGERCIDPPRARGGKSTARILRVILESCDTAAQATGKLSELIRAGDYSHGGQRGSIFLFMDSKEGYVCETTATFCTVQRYDRGYTVRSSLWHNPNMYQHSRETYDIYLRASNRAYMAISGLNRILDEHGKIRVSDIFELSRHCTLPKGSPMKRSLCGNTTNSGATLEIDKQFPETLSTMYVTVGHPRHTVYLPIPVCVREVLPAMANLRWSTAAFRRLDELKLEASIPPEWTKFEADSMMQYGKAKAHARKLLEAGKRAEAVDLLNSAAKRIWKTAATLLNIRE